MDQAAAPRHLLDGLLRSVESVRFGPFWLTLGLAAAIFAAFLLWCALFGQLDQVFATGPSYRPRMARTTGVLAALTAFLVTARRYEVRKAPEDWAPLQPLTPLSPAGFAELLARGRQQTQASRLAFDLAGVVVGIGMVVLSSGERGWILRGENWDPFLVWSFALNAVLFVTMARAAHASLQSREINDRLAAAIVQLDLLDTTPLRSFARQGLRRAFYWAGGSSIASLLGLDLTHFGPLLAILALTLGLASFALLDPVRVVRARIRSAKRAELERLRQRIRDERSELLTRSHRASEAAARLPGLLAYEARIASVSEWPFDASTLIRFGALSLLATGSWLGGAVVERLLDAVLR